MIGGDYKPYREKAFGYNLCTEPFQMYQPDVIGNTVKKNTTRRSAPDTRWSGNTGYSTGYGFPEYVAGPPVTMSGFYECDRNADTGISTVPSGVDYYNVCSPGAGAATSLDLMGGGLDITGIAAGGTGYTSGATVTFAHATAEVIDGVPQYATAVIHATAGVVDEIQLLTPGQYTGDFGASIFPTGGGGSGLEVNVQSLFQPCDFWKNTFGDCDALASVAITNGGTGYKDGEILTAPDAAYPQLGKKAKFRINVTGGVIQSASVMTGGIYAGIGANALSAQTSATGGSGTGAVFAYTTKSATFNFGVCNQVGWAFATAKRQHHGSWGFLSPALCKNCTDGDYTVDDTKYLKVDYKVCFIQGNLWLGYIGSGGGSFGHPQPEQVDVSDYWTGTDGESFIDSLVASSGQSIDSVKGASLTGSTSVGANSGVLEYNVHTKESECDSSFDQVGGEWVSSRLNKIDGVITQDSITPANVGNWSGYGGYIDIAAAYGFPKCGSIPNAANNYFTSTPTADTPQFERYSTDSGATWTDGTPSFDPNDYTDGELLWYEKFSYVRTGTQFDWLYVTIAFAAVDTGGGVMLWADGMPFPDYRIYTGKITLSNPNTAKNLDPASTSHPDVVWDGEQVLLNQWNLNDRKMMPLYAGLFKGDGQIKVSRNEVQSPVSPFTSSFQPYYVGTVTDNYKRNLDPNAALLKLRGVAAGAILGAPLEVTPDPDTGKPPATNCGGYYPLDYFMPDFQSYQYGCCWDGAFEVYDPTGGSPLDCSTPEFTRTKFGSWRTEFPNLPPRATQWTDKVEGLLLVAGRQRFAGIIAPYTAAASPGLWFTKYTESAGRFPSYNHARPYGLDRTTQDRTLETCVAGVLTCAADCTRWNNVPPMAGRVKISAIVDNGDGTVTVTHDAMPVLNVADAHNPLYAVNLCADNMTALAADLTPADSTTTSCKVTASFATVSGAKWLTLHGALPTDTSAPAEVAHWYFADNRGKGDYWIGEWALANGVYADCLGSAHSKKYGSSFPYLITLSPNATDTPDCGVRYDFASLTTPDEKCGSAQWLAAIQAMVDPLYHPPLACEPAECEPLVEARLTLPYAGDPATDPAPTGGNYANYTVDLTAATGIGDNPPAAYNPVTLHVGDQPTPYYAPTGTYPPCPP